MFTTKTLRFPRQLKCLHSVHRCTQGERGEEGGTSCTLSKEFEKLDHKKAIKLENRGPPYHIFSQPQVPTQKNLE